MQATFFQGTKVIELASVLAGPAVGLFFAELGAEVIKIENPLTQGDVTRRWKAPGEDTAKTDSAYFRSVNFYKRSLFLDVSQPDDRRQVEALVAQADVVIVNYRPGGAEKLGMDYASLSALNPRLVYAELSGFGPDDSRPAFDVVLQAETGFMHLTGDPDGPPVKMPVALIDLLAAHQLKAGILMALLHRERTGRGSRVGTNLYAAALASLANQATNWLIAGHAPQRMGSEHPNIAPYGDIFHTADGQPLVLAVGVEAHFRQLCTMLGLPALADNPRFNTNAARVAHRPNLVAALQAAIAIHPTRTALLDMLETHGIPAGAIRDLPDVFAQPSAQALLVDTYDDAGQSIQCVPSVAFTLSES